jgi:hypothetical protein
MKYMILFKGRELVIATMHGKEQVLKPLLEAALGVQCILPDEFNSDEFGTFSGEVERIVSPLEAAQKKCYAALKKTNTTLAIASEGSFGPHPVIGFVPADEELLLLIDTINNLEIKVKEISTATNFAGKEIFSLQEAKDFAATVLFPSHGLIIKKSKNDLSMLHKGIDNVSTFYDLVSNLLLNNHSIYIETDMRAHYNPSRMLVIDTACKKLITTLQCICKQCGTPGFSIKEFIPGLPCEFCSTPTRSTKSAIYVCEKCAYSEEIIYPNGKQFEDPMYCDRCNP